MQLDASTLMVAGAFVALMSGTFLLYAWYQYRETRAALWWAGADFVLACGIVMLAVGSGADEPLILVTGITLMSVSSSLTWAGARSFDGHDVSPAFLALGNIICIGTQWLPSSALTPAVTALLNISIMLVYYGAAALSIQLGRGEALRARLPVTVLLAVHALTIMIAVSASLTMTLQPNHPPPVLSWSGLIHFEVLIFAIGTAIFLIVMMKERNEGRLLATSHTDALTGVENRRGFFLKAERIIARCRRDGSSIAVVAFDLDRFKAINDTGGHATGDRVLQVFAEVCRRMLRPGDLIGRLGGEEFAAMMPGSDIEAGYAMAERVRKAVAEADAIAGGSPVKITVSGGVAASSAPDDIHALLHQADIGLYRAKSLGRNRIECFDTPGQVPAAANLIRVA
jgi:diguanylate cyclase (GGDEF)-like protein